MSFFGYVLGIAGAYWLARLLIQQARFERKMRRYENPPEVWRPRR